MSELLYAVVAVAFITGLKRLSSPASARVGNLMAALGMLLAVAVTVAVRVEVNLALLTSAVAIGGVIGAIAAERVAMTSMPQMVAVLNGLGGAASALVAGSEVLGLGVSGLPLEIVVGILLSVAIGTVTVSGSAVAVGKLQGILSGRPVVYPARYLVASVITVAAVAVGVYAIVSREPAAVAILGGIALLVGVLMVLPIGGSDMPVVISLLNSLSGLAAAATGFAIGNSVLVIGGALVGAAGFTLTAQMCRSMNRSLLGVLFGAFGGGRGLGVEVTGGGAVKRAEAEDVAIALAFAGSVLIVPGFGLAAAQAQHAVRGLADLLEERGIEVAYAIHPVAGRMPGHMNVLLAEADVPYEQLLDLEVANPRLSHTDVVVVVGANDVVNTSARDDPSSPIFGMPILEVDRAGTVVIIKRSMAPGFAGIDNPLFTKDTTMMFFSDAREGLEKVTAAIENL